MKQKSNWKGSLLMQRPKRETQLPYTSTKHVSSPAAISQSIISAGSQNAGSRSHNMQAIFTILTRLRIVYPPSKETPCNAMYLPQQNPNQPSALSLNQQRARFPKDESASECPLHHARCTRLLWAEPACRGRGGVCVGWRFIIWWLGLLGGVEVGKERKVGMEGVCEGVLCYLEDVA